MRRRRLTVIDGRQELKADSLRLWHLVAVGLAFQSLALVRNDQVGFPCRARNTGPWPSST